MNLLDTQNLHLLHRYLDLASFRQGLIAENLANIDTPGYRTRDIDFSRELNSALANPEHRPRPSEPAGLLQRPDGNNVGLDREGLLMAKTQLQFRTAVQLLRSEFRRLQTAIQEGRQS